MARKGEQIQVSELDFETIKENLITYFKSSGDGEFTDWDFESSNLNNLMDVLAYNTHYNAVTAHMAVNESFIDSAQLRANIVSAAKLLGYTPRSFSSSLAILDGKFRCDINAPETYVLPKGTTCSAQLENISFPFTVVDDIITLRKIEENGSFFYITSLENPIVLHEGKLFRRQFPVDASRDDQRYEIIDNDIDLNTLIVRVYPSSNRTKGTAEVYNRYDNIGNVDGNTNIYFIYENSFGLYEISFGNGVFGKQLKAKQVLEIEYLVTSGVEANGLNREFKLATIPDESNPILSTVSLQLRNSGKVFGGSNKESNNELKINAINNFSTQNRAVTADDYKNLILSKFGYIQSASVWGGEDNVPPVYGKVFIALDTYSENNVNYIEPLSALNKAEILDYLKTKKILALQPEIVDAKYINLVLDILFKYDTNITSLAANEMQKEVRDNVLTPFNNEVLNKFDTVFRHSQFVGEVDNYSRAILNTHVRVYVQQTIFIPDDASRTQFDIDFGVQLDVDDDELLVQVDSDFAWKENEERIFIEDEANPLNNRVRDLYLYKLVGPAKQRLRQVGSANIDTGLMTLNSIFADNPVNLRITVHPRSNDIVGKTNYLLRINESDTQITVSPDEIAKGGSSRAVEYSAFPKERY